MSRGWILFCLLVTTSNTWATLPLPHCKDWLIQITPITQDELKSGLKNAIFDLQTCQLDSRYTAPASAAQSNDLRNLIPHVRGTDYYIPPTDELLIQQAGDAPASLGASLVMFKNNIYLQAAYNRLLDQNTPPLEIPRLQRWLKWDPELKKFTAQSSNGSQEILNGIKPLGKIKLYRGMSQEEASTWNQLKSKSAEITATDVSLLAKIGAPEGQLFSPIGASGAVFVTPDRQHAIEFAYKSRTWGKVGEFEVDLTTIEDVFHEGIYVGFEEKRTRSFDGSAVPSVLEMGFISDQARIKLLNSYQGTLPSP